MSSPRRPQLLAVFTLLILGLVGNSFATAPWYNSAWSHRLEFTAQPSLIEDGETFTEFTLLLELNATDHPTVYSVAKSDGSDLVLTGYDGNTVLAHELIHHIFHFITTTNKPK